MIRHFYLQDFDEHRDSQTRRLPKIDPSMRRKSLGELLPFAAGPRFLGTDWTFVVRKELQRRERPAFGIWHGELVLGFGTGNTVRIPRPVLSAQCHLLCHRWGSSCVMGFAGIPMFGTQAEGTLVSPTTKVNCICRYGPRFTR
jgi:hypothetical protein